MEFSKSEGLPQRQEEKARARATSKAAKNKKAYEFFYTEQNGKILKVTAKPNGAYSEFIAKKPRAGTENSARLEAEYKSMIAKYKKEGAWVGSDMYDDKVKELIKQAK